jgi:hypothetical protein
VSARRDNIILRLGAGSGARGRDPAMSDPRPVPPGQEEIVAAADSALAAGREYMDQRCLLARHAREQIVAALDWLDDEDAARIALSFARRYMPDRGALAFRLRAAILGARVASWDTGEGTVVQAGLDELVSTVLDVFDGVSQDRD